MMGELINEKPNEASGTKKEGNVMVSLVRL